jgi:hypothetical protein
MPAIMTDGNGVWVAVWDSNMDIDSAGVDGDALFSKECHSGDPAGPFQIL